MSDSVAMQGLDVLNHVDGSPPHRLTSPLFVSQPSRAAESRGPRPALAGRLLALDEPPSQRRLRESEGQQQLWPGR